MARHQRPHKRKVRKTGKSFKAGRGTPQLFYCPKCPLYQTRSSKCGGCPMHRRRKVEVSTLPEGRKYYVVSRVLKNGMITTNMYETTRENQDKLVVGLRQKFGPSAGITKGSVEISNLPNHEPLEGARHHKLMTAELRKMLPKLYAQEKVKDPIVYAKYFSPYSGWTWYATEFDGEDRFFGLVKGFETELGYFSLQEMAEVNRNGLPLVERDIYFTPKKLSEVRKE